MNIKNHINKLNNLNKSNNDVEFVAPILELKTKKIKIVNSENISEIRPTLSYLGSNKAHIIPRSVSLVSSYKVKQKFKKDDETNTQKNKNMFRTSISKMDTTQINCVIQDVEYIKWKKLDISIKKEKIKEFYEKID
jgi:hypothetical protein